MSDFFKHTVPGCYEADFIKKHVEHWYDCTFLGLAVKQKETLCAQTAIMGLVFVLYCVEYEERAVCASDLQDIFP